MTGAEKPSRPRPGRIECAAAFVVALLLLLGLLGSSRSPRVLLTVRAHYLEDAAVPRPIAAITAQLVAVGEIVQLELAIAAVGAGIDPLPGVAGVPGSNLRTAEELDRLLRGGALQLRTRSPQGVADGRCMRITRGFVPRRRWARDGGIEAAPPSGAELPLVVCLGSAPLPLGTSCSYLECDGSPRLSVEVSLAPGGAPRVGIASLPAEPSPPGQR